MISQTQLVLLNAIRGSLFDEEPLYPLDTDWNEVVLEAKAQTVMGLISPKIPVYDEEFDKCKAFFMRVMFEQDQLLKCFDANQIPCVILKGCAAAVYYSKPHLRTMGDIDVLVPRNRFIDALEILETNGYVYDHGKGQEESVSRDTRELVYIKNGIIVEIHQRFSTPGVDVDDILESAIDRREYHVINGYKFPVLPCPENGLVLLGHINQHLKQNKLGLRQIIDWEMFVFRVAEMPLWDIQFVPLLKRTGLLTLAAHVTRLCNRYLGLPYQKLFGIDVDDILVDELLAVVLNDGNFGRKVYSSKNLDEKKLISASYELKRDGIFRYFTRIGMSTSVFFRKHHSFYILAFFYGFFRVLSRSLRILLSCKGLGKQFSEGNNLYELHSKRQELYKKMGVSTGEE